MTATQFRAALRRLGLSQRRLALQLKVDPKTTNRWARGRSPIPEAVALLLAACSLRPSSRGRMVLDPEPQGSPVLDGKGLPVHRVREDHLRPAGGFDVEDLVIVAVSRTPPLLIQRMKTEISGTGLGPRLRQERSARIGFTSVWIVRRGWSTGIRSSTER